MLACLPFVPACPRLALSTRHAPLTRTSPRPPTPPSQGSQHGDSAAAERWYTTMHSTPIQIPSVAQLTVSFVLPLSSSLFLSRLRYAGAERFAERHQSPHPRRHLRRARLPVAAAAAAPTVQHQPARQRTAARVPRLQQPHPHTVHAARRSQPARQPAVQSAVRYAGAGHSGGRGGREWQWEGAAAVRHGGGDEGRGEGEAGEGEGGEEREVRERGGRADQSGRRRLERRAVAVAAAQQDGERRRREKCKAGRVGAAATATTAPSVSTAASPSFTLLCIKNVPQMSHVALIYFTETMLTLRQHSRQSRASACRVRYSRHRCTVGRRFKKQTS